MTFWNSYRRVGNEGSEDISYDYGARIYIGSAVSRRFIELPAFVENLKYELNKDIEAIEEKDKTGTRYINKSSTVSINLSINVPSATPLEAHQNLLRVSEIMRMISPSGINAEGQPSPAEAPKIYMLFSNLISKGNRKTPNLISRSGYDNLKKHGLPCYIKDFTYDPDIEAGFFVDGVYRSPRNIKVSIAASIEAIPWDSTMEAISEGGLQDDVSATVIRGFSSTGEYTPGDCGGFPFGIMVKDSRHRNKDYSFHGLNSYNDEYSDEVGSFFVIGNNYEKQKGSITKLKRTFGSQNPLPFHLTEHWNTPVWCKFKMFLEDYKFKKITGLEPIKIENSDTGVSYKNYSDSDSEFDITFSIYAEDLDEAKKNCGKIQVLMRLFFSENFWDFASDSWENISNIKRNIYSPNLLENHVSKKSKSNDWSKLWADSIGCHIKNISVDIEGDLGYFMDNYGGNSKRYYPKGFKIKIDGAVTGQNSEFSGRPGNYKEAEDGKQSSRLKRNDIKKIIQFPFKI